MYETGTFQHEQLLIKGFPHVIPECRSLSERQQTARMKVLLVVLALTAGLGEALNCSRCYDGYGYYVGVLGLGLSYGDYILYFPGTKLHCPCGERV